MQRLTLKFDEKKEYKWGLSKKLLDNKEKILNSEWLNSNNNLFKILDETKIINKEEIKTMDEYPSIEEIGLFTSKYY